MTAIRKSKITFSFKDVLRFAASYWVRQPWRLSVILFLLFSSALIETWLPSALSSFLNAIEHQPRAVVITSLCIFIGTYLAHTLLFIFAFRVYNVFETTIFKSLVDDVFANVYLLPEKFFANTFTGSIVSRINRARVKMEVFEDQILVRIFSTVIIMVGSLLFLAMHFPILSVLLIIYVLIFVVISAWLVFRISGPAQGIYADAQDHFSAHLADSVSGIATTKSYAQEDYELSRFHGVTEDLRKKNLRAYHLGNITGFFQRILLTGMLALLMGGGTWYYFNGMATVGNMAYLALAYTIMASYIREVGENIKNLLTSSYDLHGVMVLLHEQPEVPVNIKLPELTITRGGIEYDQVDFTYPGKKHPIFNNLSMKIREGERIALVGHSGGGKTTFIRLLQCLYPIQQGCIRIDGQDITNGTRASLRRSMSLVPQDPILFHRSLRDNIAYAKPDATDAEIHAAAQKAHIEKFILNLPYQYDTLVGERGVKLSGGERQRIAIARAILADRPILILDEATSSLDSESERAIQDALYSLTHGRTSIMIAHRLSTILDADRILVFDAGIIVEEGSHNDLIKIPNGIYASLFKLQSGGFIAE